MKTIPSTAILATRACFRQRVTLPVAQVEGLSPTELAAALAFEIEPFSGVAQAAAEMAWKPLPVEDASRRTFDVVQIRRSECDSLVAAARKAGQHPRAVTAEPAADEKLEQLPLILLSSSGFFSRGPWTWYACAVVLVGLALAGEGMWRQCETRALAREVAAREVLEAERQNLENRLGATRRAADSVRRERAEQARAQQNAAVLRAAWQNLFEAVSGACRDESVVRALVATGPWTARLELTALSAEAAARTLMRLAEALRVPKTAWRLAPGALTALPGGTATFACELTFDPEDQFK